MLHPSTLPLLHEGRNLLAFSGGVDSSALFFLLLQEKIPFDIAIVNYHTREQSTEEVAYAQSLAKQHTKHCHLLDVNLDAKSFEAQARKTRYDFFKTLAQEHGYTNLITAHQLDDRLEWLLMQLTKGAGLYELLGMKSVEKREEYTLVRPLLEVSREKIEDYLEYEEIHFFQDASNHDESYQRNYIRHNFAKLLIKQYSNGIRKSLGYLDEDCEQLIKGEAEVSSLHALHYFLSVSSRRSALVSIDKFLKKQGFLMRQGDKEALKLHDEHVVGRKYVVSFHKKYCFIAPYVQSDMPKEFKEQCRLLAISPKLRPYLFQDPIAFEHISKLLKDDKK